jgi:hypothetical protein
MWLYFRLRWSYRCYCVPKQIKRAVLMLSLLTDVDMVFVVHASHYFVIDLVEWETSPEVVAAIECFVDICLEVGVVEFKARSSESFRDDVAEHLDCVVTHLVDHFVCFLPNEIWVH